LDGWLYFGGRTNYKLMIIKVNYTVSDIYMSTSVSPVYIKVVYSGTSGGGNGVWGAITGTLSNQIDLQSALDLKVPTSRTLTINGVAFDLSANRSWTIDALPSQTGNSGKYLTTNGTIASWGVINLSGYVPYTGATGAVNLGANNLTANNVFTGFSTIAASGTQVVLTINSVPEIQVTGSGGQTIKLPDATTLANGTTYRFNNNQSSGAILVNNNSNTLVVSVPSGGYVDVVLLSNSIAAGSWDRHDLAPANVSWSTNTFDYPGSITSATWNGNAVAINRGGTGASTAGGALTNLGAVPTTRTITINGTTLDLSADRSWTIGGMAIGGSITSATAGSVLFAGTSGVLQQNNANFFWDDTNNRLGIGTNTINASAKVQIDSTTSGFLQPRLTTTQRDAIVSPANGLQVYNTTNNNNDFYNGIGWVTQVGVFTNVVANQVAFWNQTNSITGSTGLVYNDSTGAFTLSKNQNGVTQLVVTNTTNGASSQATVSAVSSNGVLTFAKASASVSAYKILLANDGYFYNSTLSGDIAIFNDFASGKIKFAAGSSSTAQMTLTAAGRLLLGTTTDTGLYQLDVNGTARVSSDAIINEQTIGKGLGNQSGNFAAGKGALKANTTGNFNTAIGSNDVLGANLTGTTNVGVGTSVLNVSTGSANTGIGSGAFLNMTSGDRNVAIGTDAARALPSTSPLTSATDSIFIGRSSTAPANSQTNQIVIGASSTGLGSNTTTIGNSSTTLTALYGSLIIGGTSVNASAQVQIDSTTKGFLPPRMTNAQRTAITSPAVGLIVYCTDTVEGLYIYKSMGWTFVI